MSTPSPPSPPPSSPTPSEGHATDQAPATAASPPRGPRPWLSWMLVIVSLGFGLWGAWRVLTPDPDNADDRLRTQRARIETLEQQVATLSRSDQISRDANRDVQGTLAERDEEVAGLRADVAFYERFVGATGQRRGLAVHELQLAPQAGNAWHFTATLTQNLNRGAVSRGSLSLSIEGTRDGKLQRLAWSDLRQQPNAPAVDYSFKYFQQTEGDIVLPPGFTPLRVAIRLQPPGAKPVDHSFAWAEATREGEPGA